MIQISDYIIDKAKFKKVHRNNELNIKLAEYFMRLANDTRDIFLQERFYNNSSRICNCQSFFISDLYESENIKDIKKVNNCKISFCNNCKKLKQASRSVKFMPVLQQSNNLFHVVFTAPNVTASDLKKAIDAQFLALKKIFLFLSGKIKIKKLDCPISVLGVIRSLEVTNNNNTFHPHLHCAFDFVSINSFLTNKVFVNDFSFDNKKIKKKKYFSEFEILIQKLFKLYYEKFFYDLKYKVDAEKINNCEIGFSCSADLFDENDYSELFKYITKDDFSDCDYETFKTLYFALYRKRQIQGYGSFYSINKIEDDIYNLANFEYEQLVKFLRDCDEPQTKFDTPEMLSKSKFDIISKKRILHKLINEVK